MRDKATASPYWLSTVSIDSYEDGVPKGRLHNPFFESPQSFESLTQFIRIMECTLDLTKTPQSFTSHRSFAPPGQSFRLRNSTVPERGKLASFSLCIRFRQNSSWQGQLHWLEEGRRQNFRSTLEMILLMDSALQSAGRRQKEANGNTA